MNQTRFLRAVLPALLVLPATLGVAGTAAAQSGAATPPPATAPAPPAAPGSAAARGSAVAAAPTARATGLVSAYQEPADRLIDAALRDSAAYERLGDLVDTFGPRLSGSRALEDAIDWVMARMKEDGLENVHGEKAMVPHWVRGEESLRMTQPRERDLPMLGLGGSIATPPGGITAPVLVVSSFDELHQRAAEARGKIVLFDAPFVTYGETVRYRSDGAVEAAKAGAVASLIRSVASFSMNSPHTGAMDYEDSVTKIPHAAITVEDAEMLHRMQERGVTPVLHLEMSAETLPDSPSRNVIAEIRGREKPDEVVVVSGHLDSWDVGQGAMDDGGGVVAAWQAVRLMKELGMRPRRTVRVVAWTNEENGTRGGRAYAADHADQAGSHVLMIESDEGVFRPEGFGFTGSDSAFQVVQAVGRLLARIDAGEITRGGGGADIGPMMRLGVPGMGLTVDGEKYFWYHHSEADTLDKLDPEEMARCVAALAVMSYVVADMPEKLPR